MSLRINADQPSTDQSASFLDQRPKLLFLILVSLFFLAGAARLYRLQAPGMLPERDFGSAILARDLFFRHSDTVPEWKKAVSMETLQNIPILEPPVTEFLVSLLYRVIGSEQIWMARLLTSSFWLLGGIFLYKIAKMFLSTEASIVTTAFYLLTPLGILLSRSFQPDALMMLMFLASLFCISKYYERPSQLQLVAAITITGLTVLHRPIVLPFLFSAFAALAIAEQRTWKGIIQPQKVIFFVLSLLPSLLYYGYITFITDGRQALMSFQPHILLQRVYWKGWLDLGISAVGATALVAAVLGLAMLPAGRPLALVTGLWFGYLIFGLTFTYHIHTHKYYHALLIPIVALSFGPLVSVIVNRLSDSSKKRYWILSMTAIVILTLTLGLRQVRANLGNRRFAEEEVAREIGEIVDHSSKIVYISRNYGVPLQYYGELTGTYWPRRISSPLYLSSHGLEEHSVEERLDTLHFTPEYFTITDFSQFSKYHTDLKDYLITNCTLIAEKDEYLIYAECVG